MKPKRQLGERAALQAAIADGSIVGFTWEEENCVQVITIVQTFSAFCNVNHLAYAGPT